MKIGELRQTITETQSSYTDEEVSIIQAFFERKDDETNLARAEAETSEAISVRLVEEDEFEDTSDAENDLENALNLLEICAEVLRKVNATLDFHNISIQPDYWDAALDQTIRDCDQFLDQFEREKKAAQVPMAVISQLSKPCKRGKHSKCDLIACNCYCHDEEKE